MKHHRHYLVYVQLSLLASLLIIGTGVQGFMHVLSAAAPFIVSAVLLLITVKLCLAIMRMLIDPDLVLQRTVDYMHGSALPVMVYAPQN